MFVRGRRRVFERLFGCVDQPYSKADEYANAGSLSFPLVDSVRTLSLWDSAWLD